MKSWKIITVSKIKNSSSEIIDILLRNRGLKDTLEIEEFLNPKLESVTAESVSLDKNSLSKTVKRIKKAVQHNEKIVIFGDYDVDGICGTAILWESIYAIYKNVIPYIPDRFSEGYGLSIKGIENILKLHPDISLIITVDNGVVAHEAVSFANSKKIDVIITDHHVQGKTLPEAYSVVHTTKLCGTGVAWLLAKKIRSPKSEIQNQDATKNSKQQSPRYANLPARRIGEPRITISSDPGLSRDESSLNSYLDLVCLATVADLVPLTGANRTLVIAGLERLRTTQRIGLNALFTLAGIQKQTLGIYEIGHIICPRLNAAGRLFTAMDSLRLICTKNREKAQMLAFDLEKTNKERQLLTQFTADHAKQLVKESTKRIMFAYHESYNEGIIGLVASRLVEEYYRPSFVVAVGEKKSKGSARSIRGVNIIEMIRAQSHIILQSGGHPMAAGFTLETSRIAEFKKELEKYAEKVVSDTQLERSIIIDLEIDFSDITYDFYKKLQKLSPFGMGNPEPTFITKNAIIDQVKVLGKDRKHLKIKLSHCDEEKNTKDHSCIAFGIGERIQEFDKGTKVDVVYTIAEDTWLGNGALQLKIKDIKNISLN